MAKERTSLTPSRSAEGLDGKRSSSFTVVPRLTVDGGVFLSACLVTRVPRPATACIAIRSFTGHRQRATVAVQTLDLLLLLG
jgi:hypothetical protein